MFTLLPEEYKNNIVGKYRRRVFIVLLTGCVSVTIFSLLLQFSTYMTVRAEHNELDMELNTLRVQTANNGETAIGINLNELNLDLNLLSSSTPSVLPFIYKTFERLVPGVNISKIEYTLLEGAQFNMNLNGNAQRRVDLSLFNKSLKLEETFKKIELPIESLAKEADIDFNIKIEGLYE